MKYLQHKLLLLPVLIILTALNLFAQTEREKGLAFYETGDYKAAIESLEKSLKTNDKDGEAWRLLGMAYVHNKESNKAISAFEKAKNITDEDLKKNYDTPVKITSKPYARFTDQARRNQVSGKVILAVEFRADGTIGRIFPFKVLPDGLTENTIEAVRKIKFEPAIRKEKAVTVIQFIEYNFTIY